MSFLTAKNLVSDTREAYNQGDLKVCVKYLLTSKRIGTHVIMVKPNFPTACWVPPVGKRATHTIYYGDRMLERLIERFVRVHEIPAFDAESFVKKAKAAKPTKNSLPVETRAFELQLQWLKKKATEAQWEIFVDWMVQAVESYGRHERQHARETCQDLKRVSAELRLIGVPFSYLNLFEDARIEEISRKELRTKFNWTLFEELAPPRSPWNLYLRCIQLENTPDEVALADESPLGSSTVKHVASRVAYYYQQTLLCKSTEALYPVLAAFLKEFKSLNDELKSQQGPNGEGEGSEGGPSGDSGEGSGGDAGGEGGESSSSGSASGEDADGAGDGEGKESKPGSKAGKDSKGKPSKTGKPGDKDGTSLDVDEEAGDLTIAAEAADKGDSFFEAFEAGAESVGSSDDTKGQGTGPQKTEGSLEGTATPKAAGGRATESDFLTNKEGTIDAYYQDRVTALTQTLLRMFKTKTLPLALEAPQKRLSSRHLARGEIMYIHRKQFGGKGKRKFVVAYDCSGSMAGAPMREGKIFLLALNELAKRGYLEGSLILTGWVAGSPGWLKYSFPLKDSVIMRIAANHSSEGINSALKDNIADLTSCDDVFVYTDASICDLPMDKKYFAARRVWPVGLYVGKDEHAEEMERHFPQHIIRETIESLVEVLLTRNRRTTG